MSNNNLSEHIGNMIRIERKNKGLTQTDLACMTDTKQPSIAQLENGKRLPSLRFLKKVGDSLNVEIGIGFKDRVIQTM